MTRQRMTLLGSAALIAAAASACDTADRDRMMGRQPSGAVETSSMPSGTVTTTQIPPEFRTMRGEQLIGKSVYSSAGERVGEIDEIVVNRNSRATGAVVGVGGFLGIGEKKVVLPLDSMRMQGDRIVAPGLTRDGLTTMTAYQSDGYYRYERSRTLGELVR
jgi:sporulation protein YlmC with PRC-barrel domain